MSSTIKGSQIKSNDTTAIITYIYVYLNLLKLKTAVDDSDGYFFIQVSKPAQVKFMRKSCTAF